MDSVRSIALGLNFQGVTRTDSNFTKGADGSITGTIKTSQHLSPVLFLRYTLQL